MTIEADSMAESASGLAAKCRLAAAMGLAIRLEPDAAAATARLVEGLARGLDLAEAERAAMLVEHDRAERERAAMVVEHDRRLRTVALLVIAFVVADVLIGAL